MPETEIQKRHKEIFLKMCPKGTWLFIMKYRNSNKNVIGAKFFIATNINEIEDVSSYVATIAGRKWNNNTGIVESPNPGNLVDCLGSVLHDDSQVYNFKYL